MTDELDHDVIYLGDRVWASFELGELIFRSEDDGNLRIFAVIDRKLCERLLPWLRNQLNKGTSL